MGQSMTHTVCSGSFTCKFSGTDGRLRILFRFVF